MYDDMAARNLLKLCWMGAFGFAALTLLVFLLIWAGKAFLNINLGLLAFLAVPFSLIAVFFSLAILLMSAAEIIASPRSILGKLQWLAVIILLAWIGLLAYYFFGRKWLEVEY